mmetsp:Transcript_12791/g.38582  ORF Transcript_12791/g.38582 Transcript_12791/m.38582 type:complete len:243 (+) Transcript_12791:570-1298(+)
MPSRRARERRSVPWASAPARAGAGRELGAPSPSPRGAAAYRRSPATSCGGGTAGNACTAASRLVLASWRTASVAAAAWVNSAKSRARARARDSTPAAACAVCRASSGGNAAWRCHLRNPLRGIAWRAWSSAAPRRARVEAYGRHLCMAEPRTRLCHCRDATREETEARPLSCEETSQLFQARPRLWLAQSLRAPSNTSAARPWSRATLAHLRTRDATGRNQDATTGMPSPLGRAPRRHSRRH